MAVQIFVDTKEVIADAKVVKIETERNTTIVVDLVKDIIYEVSNTDNNTSTPPQQTQMHD